MLLSDKFIFISKPIKSQIPKCLKKKKPLYQCCSASVDLPFKIILITKKYETNSRPLYRCCSAICWEEMCASGGAKPPPTNLKKIFLNILSFYIFFPSPLPQTNKFSFRYPPIFISFFSSPLPRTWTISIVISSHSPVVSSRFIYFFSKPPPKNLNTFSFRYPPLFIVYPVPLPRSWKISIVLSSNFYCSSKPPPTNLKGFHCIILPFYIFFSKPPSTNLENFHRNILPFFIFFFLSPLPQTWTPFHIKILPFCISFSKPHPTRRSTVSAHPLIQIFSLQTPSHNPQKNLNLFSSFMS